MQAEGQHQIADCFCAHAADGNVEVLAGLLCRIQGAGSDANDELSEAFIAPQQFGQITCAVVGVANQVSKTLCNAGKIRQWLYAKLNVFIDFGIKPADVFIHIFLVFVLH